MKEPYTEVQRTAPEPQFQLTVITVCRNALAELKPTVESVLAQKARGSISIEHLVVDGASTDGTPEWLAEQLAAGNIERYVSEPDCGIYDAMNKGINLARGEVLAFLNAGDAYAADTDLAECVLPICRGETESVAAVACFDNSPSFPYHTPDFRMPFFHAPCCHQAFFASARAYRRFGGYDAGHFKCGADGDTICRIYYECGEPLISNLKVVHYDTTGLSTACRTTFLNECAEVMCRHWESIIQKSAEDIDHLRMVEAILCKHCANFLGWQERHGLAIPETLMKLARMCNEAAKLERTPMRRLALRLLGVLYLPRLARCGKMPRGTRQVLTLCLCLCYPAPDNPYTKGKEIPGGTLAQILAAKFKGTLMRKPHGKGKESHAGSA